MWLNKISENSWLGICHTEKFYEINVKYSWIDCCIVSLCRSTTYDEQIEGLRRKKKGQSKKGDKYVSNFQGILMV